MLWGIAVCTFMPPQNFHLISIAPEASGIILSLNNSFAQLGIAAGAAIGGMVVGKSSILMNCWIAAAGLIIAIIMFGFTRILPRDKSKSVKGTGILTADISTRVPIENRSSDAYNFERKSNLVICQCHKRKDFKRISRK